MWVIAVKYLLVGDPLFEWWVYQVVKECISWNAPPPSNSGMRRKCTFLIFVRFSEPFFNLKVSNTVDGSEIRLTSWYGILLRQVFIHPRWLFEISAIQTASTKASYSTFVLSSWIFSLSTCQYPARQIQIGGAPAEAEKGRTMSSDDFTPGWFRLNWRWHPTWVIYKFFHKQL